MEEPGMQGLDERSGSLFSFMLIFRTAFRCGRYSASSMMCRLLHLNKLKHAHAQNTD
jgi:hypothetical protein